MRCILLIVVIVGMCSGVDELPQLVPSMIHGQWQWTGLYGLEDGTAVILAMGEKAGARVDLGPGRRPTVRSVTVDDRGRLSDGSQLTDLARMLSEPAMPLLARWVRMSHSDGIESQVVTVPLPVRADDPLRSVLRAHQASLLTMVTDWMVMSGGDARSVTIAEPLPTGTWRWEEEALTEVTWWSADLISTLDWRWADTGGAHPNTYLHAHTWRRSGQVWRPISLEDYLGPAEQWRARVTQAVVDDLVRQQAGWYKSDSPFSRPAESSLLRVWSIAGDGLVVSFPPYEVGPYCDGICQVRIPWAVLGRDRP